LNQIARLHKKRTAYLWFCHFRSQENIWKRIKDLSKITRSSAERSEEASVGYLLFWLINPYWAKYILEDEDWWSKLEMGWSLTRFA